MKKFLLGSALALLVTTLFAQPQQRPHDPPKPPSVAERWKRDSVKLQLYVVLNASQINAVKAAFVSFYNEMDALMPPPQNNPPAPPSREAVEKIRTKRDTSLKGIFSTPQYDRFETFEREFMPPPPKAPHPPMHGEGEKV